MGYAHIDNLYKNTNIIVNFKRCYALEKIHGTSTAIHWNEGKLSFHSGGCSHEAFVALFDKEDLTARFEAMGHDKVGIYGEGYGGKMQGMSKTYGLDLKFVAFEVKIHDIWLDVPNAEDVVVNKLGLEFVSFMEIDATLEAIDQQRDMPSVQAIRNGMGFDKLREGVVLRPLIEVTLSNGNRVVAKHKCDEFRETATKRKVDPDKLKVLEEANAIAAEWVTDERLRHVLDKLPQGIGMEKTRDVISAMIEDVLREAEGEIVVSDAAKKAIGRESAQAFKRHLNAQIPNE